MNKYYTYPNIELWQNEKWADKVPPLAKLLLYMEETNEIKDSDYEPSYDASGDLKQHPLYRTKTNGIDDPQVVKELSEMGLFFRCTSQGRGQYGPRSWMCVCPQQAIDDWHKLPSITIFQKEDVTTPLWTMRALKRQWDIVEEIAKKKDFILFIIVDLDPSYDLIFFNIMQEYSVLYPCDIDHFYLDVRPVLEKGNLRDVPGFTYADEDGNEIDPDSAVFPFTALQIPVLNMKGRWGNCDSLTRGLVMTHGMNKGRFDQEWLIHSEMGKAMAEDMLLEYKYSTVEDPAFIAEMEAKGLVYKICHNDRGERYLMLIPRQQYEEKTKLPVVLVLQEVYPGNEHLAVTAHSYCGQWLEIAAQGECAVIFFVLEDIVSNDRAIDIIRENAEEYHFDMTRIYATGHSHDGYFTYAMANRNPNFFAAIAVLGMGLTPVGMDDVPDYSRNDPIYEYDLPVICQAGLCESRFPVDEEDKKGRWVEEWTCAFRNYHIPGRTPERILASFDSKDYTERTTCLAGDRFQTLWAEGIEHYIVDFYNEAGKDHLRVVRDQNMPHTVTPFMTTLSWDFMRRFARDLNTKEVLELF